MSVAKPNRIHLLAHANPVTLGVDRFEFPDVDAYLKCIRENLPGQYKLTYRRSILTAKEDDTRGGRRDDAARIADISAALSDPNTLALLATNGGKYFSRILPHIDFSPLTKRTQPIWVFGFSEMTNLVNIVASYRCGRGVYWFCPNFLAYRVRPPAAARQAFAEFWQNVPAYMGQGEDNTGMWKPLDGKVLRGRPTSGSVRVLGGCLSVLAANLAGPLSKRMRPKGAWLAVEDVNEEIYRLDRLLATLKLGGWFEEISGLILGDFHFGRRDQVADVLQLLRFHVPNELPIVQLPEVGHGWPLAPLGINQRLKLTVQGRKVQLAAPGR